jgi:hypothetical protein
VSFLAALLILYLVYLGESYPCARPPSPTWVTWLIHGLVAVGLQAVGLALIRGLGARCGRITRPPLGE